MKNLFLLGIFALALGSCTTTTTTEEITTTDSSLVEPAVEVIVTDSIKPE